ncbi:MAG: C25 family cysteine peptidase, partial [bacterium]
HTVRVYTGGGLPLDESLAGQNPSWMKQVAVRVSDGGDGVLGGGDSLIFYGVGMRDWANLHDPALGTDAYSESFYSDFNYYWLAWGGSFEEAPSRMEKVDLPDCDGCDPYQPSSFLERLHAEVDNLPDFSVQADDGWYWRPLRAGDAAVFFAGTFSPDASRTAELRVRLADWHRFSECAGRSCFRVILRLNGIALADSSWPAGTTSQSVIDLSAPGAVTASELQRLEVATPAGFAPTETFCTSVCDRLYMAWYELDYWRRFVARDDRIFFFSPDTTATTEYRISGFTAASVYVFDVTDQFEVRQLRGAEVSGSPASVAITDTSRAGAPRRYAVVSRAGLRKPLEIARTVIDDIRNRAGAEYCVITHEDLVGPAETIAAVYGGEVVTTRQIYDEFGWGVPDATAIRDFLRWRLTSGSPIARVLLLGDATWDLKGYLDYDTFTNYVPAYELRFLPPVGDPYSTDDWFAYLVADSTYGGDSAAFWPTLPISRIPAGSPEEAEFLVAKEIEYAANPEIGPWQNRVMLVADDDRLGATCGDGSNNAHTQYAEQLASQVYPPAFERVKVYLTEYPIESTGLKTAAREDFIRHLNRGVLVANYVGHGDQYRLAQEEVFNPNAVSLVSTGRRQAFFIAASCNVSRFDEPAGSSMSEDLLRRPEGGTVGSLASTHLCLPGPNQLLNINFIKAIFDTTGKRYPVMPIADAAQVAKVKTAGWRLNFYTNSEMYALFADPALRLASPKLSVVFEPASADTLERKSVHAYSCRVMDGAVEADWFTGSAEISMREAADTSGYITCLGSFLEYDVPGSEIQRGRMDAADGEFDFQVFVPTDSREGRSGSLRCFVGNGEVSGSGVLDELVIRGESVSDDNVGPEIALSSGGRTLETGDTVAIGEIILVNMVDQSGVAIKAKSDFIASVTLSVDGGDRVDITDSVYSVDGDFTRSVASFTVPSVSIDLHSFTVEAFDNLSNLGSEDYTFLVKSSGDQPSNLVYAYPNPAADRCYLVCEYDRRVRVNVAVYTVSGRKIWTASAAGVADYHEVPWDCVDQAGDRVANGTYIVKVEARDPNDPGYEASKTVMVSVLR